MLAGLIAGGSGLMAQEPAGDHSSLYIPKAHLVEDRTFLHDFIDEYSFADLITSAPTLRVTHIPVLLDRTAGRYGKILGHISRQNPQSRTFDGRHTGVVVFRGPHGYISPAWYAGKNGVPTWNFAVVHARGRLSEIADRTTLRSLLTRLIDKFERYEDSTYDFARLPDDDILSLMAGLVGFEVEIESLEGKFKLGQDRSAADKQAMLDHLGRRAPRERSLQEFSAAFYRR